MAFLHYYNRSFGVGGGSVGRDIKCPIIRAPPFTNSVNPSTRGAPPPTLLPDQMVRPLIQLELPLARSSGSCVVRWCARVCNNYILYDCVAYLLLRTNYNTRKAMGPGECDWYGVRGGVVEWTRGMRTTATRTTRIVTTTTTTRKRRWKTRERERKGRNRRWRLKCTFDCLRCPAPAPFVLGCWPRPTTTLTHTAFTHSVSHRPSRPTISWRGSSSWPPRWSYAAVVAASSFPRSISTDCTDTYTTKGIQVHDCFFVQVVT